jgi:hypothetical protein
MSKEIILNNTTGKYFNLSYRMPGQALQILHIEVIAYALDFKVSFPGEEYYLEFKKQNAHYFEGENPILIEGKVKVRKLEKINEEGEKKTREVIDAELKQSDAMIEAVAKEKTGKPVKLKVKKGGEPTWGDE